MFVAAFVATAVVGALAVLLAWPEGVIYSLSVLAVLFYTGRALA